MTETGILDFGVYVPKRRMARKAMLEAVGWAQPGLKALGKGHKSFANWDEDAVTMSVAAARSMGGLDFSGIQSVSFASTTAPFLDRQNAGIVAAALDLPAEIRTSDVGGSQRAAVTALSDLLKMGTDNALLVSGEVRPTKPASPIEFLAGDAAGAIRVGKGNVLAKVRGLESRFSDLVDHYRTAESETDYILEERWFREMGLAKLAPKTVGALLEKADIAVAEINHLIVPLPNANLGKAVAKSIGADPKTLAPGHFDVCGHAGCAHAIVMLAEVLDRANPGDLILLTSFGQGCDAVLLEAMPALADHPSRGAVKKALSDFESETNYLKLLSARGFLDLDFGMRAERDNRTAHTVAFNKSRDVYGMVGGKCTKCGTAQFPRSRRCVNPQCGALDSQEDYWFSERRGTVKSFTEDWMAYTKSPPLIYGNVSFEGGGNIFMEMSDFAPGEIKIGTPVNMHFRIKDFDQTRGFRRYFWKAGPAKEAQHG